MNQNLKNQLKERLFFLADVEENIAEAFLESLPEAEVFKKGDIVCSAHSQSCGLGILIEGSLEIAAGSRCVSIKRMDAPDVFGAASLFGGGEYVSSMRAVAPAKIIFVSEERLEALMHRSFKVAQNYIRFLSEKVRFLNARIGNFTAGCSSAALLEHLRQNADEKGVLPVPSNMSRLAKMLNMGRTSLYRAVEELELSGRLQREEDKWIIKNLKGEI